MPHCIPRCFCLCQHEAGVLSVALSAAYAALTTAFKCQGGPELSRRIIGKILVSHRGFIPEGYRSECVYVCGVCVCKLRQARLWISRQPIYVERAVSVSVQLNSYMIP